MFLLLGAWAYCNCYVFCPVPVGGSFAFIQPVRPPSKLGGKEHHEGNDLLNGSDQEPGWNAIDVEPRSVDQPLESDPIRFRAGHLWTVHAHAFEDIRRFALKHDKFSILRR